MQNRFPLQAKVGNILIGGEIGEQPTAVIPSMFFEGHKIVRNKKKGLFLQDEAECQVNFLEQIQDETGNPVILDLVADNADALRRYTEWALETTHLPLSIDGVSMDARIPVAEWLCQIGAQKRVLYNSITPSSPIEELQALSNLSYPTCILLLSSRSVLTSDHRVEIVKNMLLRLSQFNIKQLLIDTMVIDRPSIGPAAIACKIVKQEYQLPVGCAPGNTYSNWDHLDLPKTTRSHAAMYAATVTFPVAMGADFLFTGPSRITKWIARAIAVADALLAQDRRWSKQTHLDKSHPLFHIFR
ncbi:MAG: hypothetical protein ACTSW4_05550 [Candidatus Ranarchaeia archaeon]